MPRREFYDPFIQAQPEPAQAPEPVQVNAFLVMAPGLYIAVADVVIQLLAWSNSLDGEAAAALVDAANAFVATGNLDETTEVIEPAPDPSEGRIEVYPNEDGSYWYARHVNEIGEITSDAFGNVNHEGVIAAAQLRWPGRPVYEVPDALSDSIHAESNPAATWNGRQRPSTRRLFGR